MSGVYISTVNSGQNVQIPLTNDNEQVLISATGAVVSTDNIAIEAKGSANTINVLGTVFGATNAIVMGDTPSADHDSRLFVGETGYISGSNNFYTIAIKGSNSVVENDGIIWNKSAFGFGIQLDGSIANGESKITNSGTIDVTTAAISITNNEKVHIENSGLIKAGLAISGTNGAIDVLNTGQIVGAVSLSTANDIFDTRLGKLTDIVRAYEGNDILYGSKGNDSFLGLADNDKLYGYDGNDSLDGGAGNDTLMGGIGNDTLLGGTEVDMLYGEAGNDVIDGGAGADKIFGGLGIDKLTGGTEADLFIFKAKETGVTKTTADTIQDFNKIDDIDLSAIDANTKISGNDKFSFISTQAFHGKAGELRYEKVGTTDTWIYGDTNGDKKADLVIHLDDAITMKGDYFVL
jgi:Ca2+-binding RTX toxin-like protein